MSIAPFTRKWLEREGFVGFERVEALRMSRCASVPKQGGVYVALRTLDSEPEWLPVSTGGWFKDKDPSVARSVLDARFIPETPVVYIGKGDVLKRRLDQFLRFGAGVPIGHWGGRLVWHLGDSNDLLIGWQIHDRPRAREAELVAAFEQEFGRPPLANFIR